MEKELVVNNLKLSPEEQENLRLRIIRTAKKNLKPNGKPNMTLVAEICECSKGHVSGTWKKYIAGGISAVKAVKMGRPQNSGRLTKEQQKQIQKQIVDKCPDQLRLKGFLWDRQCVCDFAYRLFKVKLTVQAMGKYLKKWGFSAQRPVKRNYKQNPVEIQKWLDIEYPKIKKRAKKEKAEIMWGDETGCQNESNYIKGFAPVGETPVLPVGKPKLRVNMISAISNQGKLRFMFYRESMNADVLISFLKRLIKDSQRKVFLILDNLKSHHAIKVRDWLKKHKNALEIFFLPPYAPEALYYRGYS
jgi:transposase